MKIEVSEYCGKIWLDLHDNQGLYTSILVLSESGVERGFITDPTDLSTKGYYITDEDSN